MLIMPAIITAYRGGKRTILSFKKEKSRAKFIPYTSVFIIYKPWQAKMCLQLYAVDSEGPDQPAHPRSLVRAFAVC